MSSFFANDDGTQYSQGGVYYYDPMDAQRDLDYLGNDALPYAFLAEDFGDADKHVTIALTHTAAQNVFDNHLDWSHTFTPAVNAMTEDEVYDNFQGDNYLSGGFTDFILANQSLFPHTNEFGTLVTFSVGTDSGSLFASPNPVPEPASCAAVALCALGLLRHHRRS